jgi:hypothetical protein
VPAGGWKYKSYSFPEGTSVGISAWQLHQEESIFPNPLSFDPERWLEPNVTDDMLNNFFAFGKGTRACIAQNLGTAEVTLAIWKVVEKDMLRGARVIDNDGKGGEFRFCNGLIVGLKGKKFLCSGLIGEELGINEYERKGIDTCACSSPQKSTPPTPFPATCTP